MVKSIDTIVAPLFVPASQPDRFSKAQSSGADAIILDLEDSVADSEKEKARNNIVAEVSKLTVPVIVRVNAIGTTWHEMDVKAVACLPIAAIILPKTENAANIDKLPSDIPLIALVETAKGLVNLSNILKTRNLSRIAFGSIDFALDLSCGSNQNALQLARSEIVLRSRAADVAAPWDGVTVQVDDLSELEVDCKHAVSLGFGGKMAIHPRQIKVILDSFRPSEVDIIWARKIVAASAAGAATQIDGSMIDKPILERAKRILAFSCLEECH